MFPGSHLSRTTYGPGLLGSPKSTADSLVPAALRTHLISAGVFQSTAVRSMSGAPWLPGTISDDQQQEGEDGQGQDAGRSAHTVSFGFE